VTSSLQRRSYPRYPTSGYPTSYPSSGYPTSGYPTSYPSGGYPTGGYQSGYSYPSSYQGGYPQVPAYAPPVDPRLAAIRSGLAQACRAGDAQSCARLRSLTIPGQIAECPRGYGY
jgi:hypothetical protein